MTVAVVAIPQSMAYAIIAGVNPVYGLYTAIVSTIIGSIFGSSSHLVAGPTNAIALLVASNMKNYMGLDNAYQILFLMTFLVNQEFIGQGLANAVSSFFQCFPGSGSFTRSAVNFHSGAVTRMAGILSGLFVGVVLFFFAPYAKYIPMPSLAGVIMTIAYGWLTRKK